jgi:hypothetical protein
VSPRSDHAGRDQPHDILAAEEFGVPATDPYLHADEPHDVLAADEFEVGASDPTLHHGPLQIPDDLRGNPEAHDVLAAEEFPVPAGPRGHNHDKLDGGMPRHRTWIAVTLAGLSVAAAIVLRRRPIHK